MKVGEKGLEVDCVVFCPAYRISDGIATFIVDTGSERTFLSWQDSKRFEIPVEDLPHHYKPIIGFGGAGGAAGAISLSSDAPLIEEGENEKRIAGSVGES